MALNNQQIMKRIFDIAVALLALVIFFPVLVLVGLLVKCKMGGPIIFRQKRPGQFGQAFVMNKFRSMRNEKDNSGNLLSDGERLTNLGRFLRSASLDELPALWNVVKGDMSLVGPRPLLIEYLPLFSPEQARRHEVRPGITGWAQVNGRNALSWEEKFKFDVWYVDNQSMMLDLKILAMTVGAVLFRRGISNDRHATMPPFQGSGPKS